MDKFPEFFISEDLDSIILENFYNLYGIEENDTSMNMLYHYLYIRAKIFFGSKKVKEDQMVDFIFEELNIDIFDGYIYYDGDKYSANYVAKSFLESLEFRANFEGEVDLKKAEDIIYPAGYKEAIKHRKSEHYKKHIQYNRLLELNKYFDVNPQSKYDTNYKRAILHNPYKRTLEEELLSIIDSENAMSTNTHLITERQLEDYLVNNLGLIEEGLIYKNRQASVSGGFIDILAKDKEGNTVIIELKIDDDKSIIWQAMHYPKVIGIERDKVRMITVAPSYNESILARLKEIPGTEIYQYNIKVSFGEIEKLEIYRIN